MLKILVVGYGKMGKLLVNTIERYKDMKVTMIVDDKFPDTSKIDELPDVIIDFSYPTNLQWIYHFVKANHIAYVCGTTGHNDMQIQQIHELGNYAPIVYQGNFSLGVSVFQEILKMITPMLEDKFDIEVIETHHNQKQDAPSGTAKMLVSAMNPTHTYKEMNGRSGMIGKRQKEIGIHAVRGGTVAGEHTVMFLGEDESLTIKHTATSKQIFINGALKAAQFTKGKENGMYTMNDILFQSNE